MEFNEALRRTLGGHWRLLVLLVVLPMVVVTAVGLSGSSTYVSKARVQASATLPTTDVQANAMLSRVRAVVTSGSVVNAALRKADITGRSASAVAHRTKVSRLGGSAVFTVKVTDRDPRTAEKLAGALSEELVAFFNGSGNLLTTELLDRQAALQDKRVRVAGQLPDADSAAESGRLTAQLGALDQQLLDVQAALRGAQADGLADRTASLLSSAGDAVAVPPLTGVDLALAGAIGLVTGLLAVTLLEVFRPHVAGRYAFGRELEAPVLGRLPAAPRGAHGSVDRPAVDDGTIVALRRAAARAQSETIVLTGPGPQSQLAVLAEVLQGRMGAVTADPPAQVPATDVHNGRYADGNGAGGRVRTLTREQVRQAVAAPSAFVAPGPASTVRVRALHQVDDSDCTRHALVAVEPELPPYAELRRVQNLMATTGWPLIGILGDGSRGFRARTRPERA
ncbi:hypothetical protein SAMN06272735_7193 [Streptomyces sp. TLI_55]|uniref:hypothetical protein n=1 Tax=Streptomyces sp. TLI_55 TaxID=1938861 RepID=UPI000BD77BCE|nr:hypothetical protein [Streptomyces sp. TLI_55]SNX65356.1 hypothetical protein SAMN06272735_7193 [Streptomyces sp. TLI_55]